MKIVGELRGGNGSILQPGYPKMECTEDNLSVHLLYAMGKNELKKLPKIGTKYKGTIPLSSDIDEVVLLKVSVESKGEDGPYMVDLEYGPEPLYDEVSGKGRNTIRKSYEMSTDDMDIPLESHPNYRTKWNHILLAKEGVSAVPEWWETGVNTVASGDYQWAKPGTTPKEGWYVLKAETKPGVESFRDGCVTVTVTKTCLKRESFDSEAKRQDYTIGAPGKTFGVSGRWLRGGSCIRREGRRWQMTVQYINSRRIDEDLYEA